MKIKIMLFGSLQEAAGTNEIFIENAGNTETLKHAAESAYPGLKGKTYRIAVDKQVVNASVPVTGLNEIAFLPPFSGG
jgi:molybdopterin converting factor small subunit